MNISDEILMIFLGESISGRIGHSNFKGCQKLVDQKRNPLLVVGISWHDSFQRRALAIAAASLDSGVPECQKSWWGKF